MRNRVLKKLKEILGTGFSVRRAEKILNVIVDEVRKYNRR